MKKLMILALALLWAAAPAILMADEAKADSDGSSSSAQSAKPALVAPELPKTDELKGTPDTGGVSKAEVEDPDGEPEVKKESVKVVQQKPGHFRWGNFLLGAFGGAVLVGGLGIAVQAADNSSGTGLDGAKVGILAGSGALGGGLLSVLLGATTPLPATPPDMSTSLPGHTLAGAKQLVFTIQF